MRQRAIKKNFWLNEKENAELKDKASRCGISESVFLRMLIMGLKPHEKPDEKFYSVVRNMSGIAGRINQLAIKANTYDYIDTDELQKVLYDVKEMLLEMQRYFLMPKESELWQRQDSGK